MLEFFQISDWEKGREFKGNSHHIFSELCAHIDGSFAHRQPVGRSAIAQSSTLLAETRTPTRHTRNRREALYPRQQIRL